MHARNRWWLSWIALGLLVPEMSWSQSTPTQITVDGSLQGPGTPAYDIPESQGVYTIGESDGQRIGHSLIQSLLRMDVGAGDTLRFSADPSFTTDHIVGRITGGTASQVDGTIEVDRQTVIGAGHLWLLNPAGFVFGEDATLDVPGGFHVSTAETLRFQGPGGEAVLEAHAGGALPGLSFPDPVGFGFVGAPTGKIELAGSCLPSCSGEGASALEFVANRVELTGGAGLVLNDGDVTIQGSEAVILSGLYQEADPNEQTNATIYVQNTEEGEGSGSINIQAGRVELQDGASVWLVNAGSEQGGEIAIEAEESIRLSGRGPAETGPYTRLGVEIPDPSHGSASITTVSVSQTAGAGAIALSAPDIEILDGAAVTAVSLPVGEVDGEMGNIEIQASSQLLLAGLGSDGEGSRIQTESLLLIGGRTPSIRIHETGSVHLRDGGTIASNTQYGATGGNIEISVSGLIRVEGEDTQRGSSIQAATEGTGAGGEISLAASRVELLAGGSLLSRSTGANVDHTLEQAGDAGKIALNVSGELILDGALIEADAVEGGGGGSVFINATGFEEGQDGSGNESLTILRDAGAARSQLVHLIDSEITTTVRGGSGDGGNVVMDATSIVLDKSAITARAEGSGSGGNILLSAEGVFSNVPLTQALDASAATGIDGRVEIQSPETNIERSLKPLAVPFLDASSLLLASCDARGESSGSFQVVSREGGGPAPDELLYVTLPGSPMPETSSEIASLYAEAVSQQGTGQWEQSLAPLEQAFTRAEAEGDASQAATLRGGLAAAALALGAYEGAETQLEAAQVEAKSADDQSLQAVLRVRQADLAAVRGRWHEALAGYRDAVQLSQRAEEAGLEAQVQASAARAALEVGDVAATEEALSASRAGISNVKEAAAQNALRLHLGVTASRLAAASAAQSAQRKQALLAAHALLTEAEAKAQASQDHRARSFALGELGILYAQERRVSEALSLARRALSAAQAADESGKAGSSADARMRWHGLEGRLLWQQGQAQEAVEAYSRAVALAEASHQDTRLRYGAGSAWFQDEVARLYRELVDVLLQAEGPQWPKAQRQALLAAARQTMEGLKVAELRDYFRDECVVQLEASARGVEDVDPRAAIVYPVVLEDRLELLVSRSDGIERYTVPVSRENFNAEVVRFGSLLKRRTTRQYLDPAQQLHAWLVAPYEGELAKQGIDTLVFVPGGVLRTVPLAALHDGQGFLIERYAVAVTPSLDLLAPESLVPGDEDLLLAGLSEPVQGFAALEGVPGELGAIESMYGGEVLLNQAFTEEEFERKLEEERPGIVHLASHAEFTGDPETSFVLTFDGRLSMAELSQLLRSGRYGEQPVELLMLSACETAAGNERAALGLAGVAVRSGARSAMGSLWPVSDEATANLVVDFYRSMGETGVSKARALQTAQNRLRKQPQFGHPFYWAPFLLINNWL